MTEPPAATAAREPWRLGVVLAVAAAATTAVALMPRLPQDPAYHAFVDTRAIAAVPNALNVLSNVPFAFVGLLGVRAWLARRRGASPEAQPTAWLTLFLGVAATAFGSGYYHWAPSSDTLFWDRLPMTIGFSGFLAAVVGERLSARAGRYLLAPLVIFGIGSVLYWRATEAAGVGDLRPYVLAQFAPLLVILVVLTLFPPRFTHARLTGGALALYASAKALEHWDGAVQSWLAVTGGHPLKHLAAAAGCYLLYLQYARRRPLVAPNVSASPASTANERSS